MASGSLDVQPFNAIEEVKGAYRCLAMDPRNANGGTAPVRWRSNDRGKGSLMISSASWITRHSTSSW